MTSMTDEQIIAHARECLVAAMGKRNAAHVRVTLQHTEDGCRELCYEVVSTGSLSMTPDDGTAAYQENRAIERMAMAEVLASGFLEMAGPALDHFINTLEDMGIDSYRKHKAELKAKWPHIYE